MRYVYLTILELLRRSQPTRTCGNSTGASASAGMTMLLFVLLLPLAAAALPYGTRKSLWDADHQDLRKVVDRICVFPSRSVDFTFGSCGSSAGPISMTTGFECSRQWRALKSCLLVRAQKTWEGVTEGATKRHDSLARKLSGRRVAVVGDSMGRQSFVALVSLLRNQSYWVDGSFGDSYVLQRSLGGPDRGRPWNARAATSGWS